MEENNNFENEKVNLMESYPCQLRHVGLSCYGCCGVDFTEKEDVETDLELNNIDFNKAMSEKDLSNEEKLKKFRDRYTDDQVGSSGVCMNLLDFGSDCEACPLHPFINKIVDKSKTVAPNSDLRVGYCDTKYECETLKFWSFMPLSQREEFVEFVKAKNFSNFEYSMKNESGSNYASTTDVNFTAKYRASCYCDAVQYEVCSDPVDAKICHCLACQKLHGAPMQWAAIFHKHDVRITEGIDHLNFYNNELNKHERILPCKVSCAICGTLIADEGRNMWLAFPSLFNFGGV